MAKYAKQTTVSVAKSKAETIRTENKMLKQRIEELETDLKEYRAAFGNQGLLQKAEQLIKELEAKIQSAKDIISSQSFWCELAGQECVGMKSIVHLVEQVLKGGD